jgi:replication-associated recombination protein RarA
MINDLVIHQATRGQLESFLANPAHAVLLCGPDGIGKSAIAQAVVAEALGLEPSKLLQHPQFLVINPEPTGTISIEAIRSLQKFLQLKTIGTNPLRRAVLVEHAQGLTTEAQNAYLKLLEEPPADTLLVLTVNTPRALLPTIISRTQSIVVHTPTEEQVQPLLKASQKDETTLRQAYFLSSGLPGLLQALLGEEEHPLLTSVTTAKAVLQKSTFERLAMVDSLSKQKEAARGLVEALERIAQAGLAQAAAKGENARLKQWHRIRKASVAAREQLLRSANAKLTLTNLMLHL